MIVNDQPASCCLDHDQQAACASMTWCCPSRLGVICAHTHVHDMLNLHDHSSWRQLLIVNFICSTITWILDRTRCNHKGAFFSSIYMQLCRFLQTPPHHWLLQLPTSPSHTLIQHEICPLLASLIIALRPCSSSLSLAVRVERLKNAVRLSHQN